MAKDREVIYQAIQDIPEAIHNAQRYLKLYNERQAYELKEKTAKLFSAVLVALKEIIIYIMSRSTAHISTDFCAYH